MRKQPDISCFTLGMRTARSAVVGKRDREVADKAQYGVGMLTEAGRSVQIEERSCFPGKFRVSINNATLIGYGRAHHRVTGRYRSVSIKTRPSDADGGRTCSKCARVGAMSTTSAYWP